MRLRGGEEREAMRGTRILSGVLCLGDATLHVLDYLTSVPTGGIPTESKVMEVRNDRCRCGSHMSHIIQCCPIRRFQEWDNVRSGWSMVLDQNHRR